MFDYDKLVERQKRLIKQHKVSEDIMFDRLNKKARIAAKQLAEKFDIEKIYLFGSLTDKYRFSLKSDVDLAVKGLDAEDFLEAWGEMEKMLGQNFDLIRIEQADKSLKDIILEEGVVIYESGQENG